MGHESEVRFIPSSAGVFLLNGQPTRVIFAWLRCSYICEDGEQAGTSVAMVHGTWSKLGEPSK